MIAEEKDGNEKQSYSTPTIAKPKPRTADRIDRVAVARSDSEEIVEIPKKAIKASDTAIEVAEITKAQAPKEASSEITPEGKRDVEISPSGVILKSSPPLSRPQPSKKQIKPVARPKSSILLANSQNQNQYDVLVANLEPEKPLEKLEISAFANKNMENAIIRKLSSYWELGTIVGSPEYEKYIVKIEVPIDPEGVIIKSGIKALDPKYPTGRYEIAFRQARNALISAGTLPIIEEYYPRGLIIEIFFSPNTGFTNRN